MDKNEENYICTKKYIYEEMNYVLNIFNYSIVFQNNQAVMESLCIEYMVNI